MNLLAMSLLAIGVPADLFAMMFAEINFRNFGLVEWAIFIVVVCAIISIVYLALQYFGVTIPPLFIRIFWVIVVCAVCIGAIRIIASM
jgi:hypothetical protein